MSLLQHPRSQDSSVGPLLCDDEPGPASLHCEAGRTDVASNSMSPESSREGLSRWVGGGEERVGQSGWGRVGGAEWVGQREWGR